MVAPISLFCTKDNAHVKVADLLLRICCLSPEMVKSGLIVKSSETFRL